MAIMHKIVHVCILMLTTPPGNNLTRFASHFAKQFLLDAKQLQNIVAENCDAIYPCLQARCSVKMLREESAFMVQMNSNQPRRISHTHVTSRSRQLMCD